MDLFENLQYYHEEYGQLEDMVEDLEELYEKEAFFEMAVISASDSKLKYDIWLDDSGSERNVKHHIPRVKLKVDGKMIPISISKEPKFLVNVSHYKKIKDIKTIFDFIAKFEDVLLMHWNKEINDRQVLNIIYDVVRNLPKEDAIRKYVFNED